MRSFRPRSPWRFPRVFWSWSVTATVGCFGCGGEGGEASNVAGAGGAPRDAGEQESEAGMGGAWPDAAVDGDGGATVGREVWVTQLGGTGTESVGAVAVDQVGNVVVVGWFEGQVDFGDGLFTSRGLDVFVVKLDPQGKLLWSRRYGGGDDQQAIAVAVDPVGRLFVAGNLRGSIDFGLRVLTAVGGQDVFLGILSPDGEPIEGRRYGGGMFANLTAMKVTAAGRPAVTGWFLGSIDFGSQPMWAVGARDVFLAQLEDTGLAVWQRSFGAWGHEEGTGIALTADREVIVGGSYGGTINLGGPDLPYAVSPDLFLAKLDVNGNHVWSQSIRDPANLPCAILPEVAPSGEIFVAGAFDGSLGLGTTTLSSRGDTDIYVAKLDAAGEFSWARQLGDEAAQAGLALAADADGGVTVAAGVAGTFEVGATMSSGGPDQDAMVVSFDGMGQPRFAWRVGDAAGQSARAVAVRGPSEVVVAGEFEGAIETGTGPLQSRGSRDAFVAVLSR